MNYLAIREWPTYQHYSDDRPPWIKLYGKLLDNADFMVLPEAAQVQLIKLWLLASRMGHPLPNDAKLLAGKIGVKGRFHLALLIDREFLTPTKEKPKESLEKSYKKSRQTLDKSSQDSKEALDESSSLACADARSRQRAEDRKQNHNAHAFIIGEIPQGDRLVELLGSEHNVISVQRFLSAVPDDSAIPGWVARFATWLDGYDLPPGVRLEANQLASAVNDYVDSPKGGDFSPVHVRRYVLRTVEEWKRHAQALKKSEPVQHEAAAKLWAGMKSVEILHTYAQADWNERISALVSSGNAPDADTFRALWKICDLGFLRAAYSDRAAVAHIAEKLASLTISEVAV